MKKLKPYGRDDEAEDHMKTQQEGNIRVIMPMQFHQGDCANPGRRAVHGSRWSGFCVAQCTKKEVMGEQARRLKQIYGTMRGNEKDNDAPSFRIKPKSG